MAGFLGSVEDFEKLKMIIHCADEEEAVTPRSGGAS
jgi:hypothetical protein